MAQFRYWGSYQSSIMQCLPYIDPAACGIAARVHLGERSASHNGKLGPISRFELLVSVSHMVCPKYLQLLFYSTIDAVIC